LAVMFGGADAPNFEKIELLKGRNVGKKNSSIRGRAGPHTSPS